MTVAELTGDSTMQEVLEAYPGARGALMRRYHIGGCSSCGFAADDRLAEVLARHGAGDLDEVIEYLKSSEKQDGEIQIGPKELAEALKSDSPPRLIDVRGPEEQAIATLDGALLATQELVQTIMNEWPRDTRIVTYCHHGLSSLEAASYLIAHGFSNTRSLRGGIDAWTAEVDPSVSRY